MHLNHYSLNPSQRNQVIEMTQYYIDVANRELKLNLEAIDVRFDLRGKSSGMFVVHRGHVYIRYNEIIFSSYFVESLNNTIAHEVAHYVVYAKSPRKRFLPHGKEWKSVMSIFGVAPEVTSKYNISFLPLKQQKRHDYECSCMKHQISTTRHNKMIKNVAVYHCRKCKQPLKLISN